MDELDELVPLIYRSRAEAVRDAIDQLLRSQRRQAVDRQYVNALADADADADADDGLALLPGDVEPASWKDIPW